MGSTCSEYIRYACESVAFIAPCIGKYIHFGVTRAAKEFKKEKIAEDLNHAYMINMVYRTDPFLGANNSPYIRAYGRVH